MMSDSDVQALPDNAMGGSKALGVKEEDQAIIDKALAMGVSPDNSLVALLPMVFRQTVILIGEGHDMAEYVAHAGDQDKP